MSSCSPENGFPEMWVSPFGGGQAGALHENKSTSRRIGYVDTMLDLTSASPAALRSEVVGISL